MRRVLVLVLALWLAPAAPAGEVTGKPVILIWGDSLSAAFGMPVESGWVQLLQRKLQEEGYPHRVVNGSVAGETTSGGLARLPAALRRHRPSLVLLELGGNDGLRGLPLAQLRANLAKLAALSKDAGARVVLFEMRMPPNYGAAYTGGFEASFAEVARTQGAALVPFWLAPIMDDPKAFLDDGIHPTAAVQPRLLGAVWPVLRTVLDDAPAGRRP